MIRKAIQPAIRPAFRSAFAAPFGGAVELEAPYTPIPFGAKFFKSGDTFTTDYVPTPPLTEGDPGVTTFYVDIATGNDSNPGTEASPFKSIFKAISTGRGVAPDLLVKVKGGVYDIANGFNNKSPEATTLAIVSWDGEPIICTAERALAPGDWTLDTGTTYYAAVPSFTDLLASVVDFVTLDADGEGAPLSLAADLATCRSTAGTYWLDDPNGRVYVHLSDGRAPDADVKVYDGWNPVGWFLDYPVAPAEIQFYVEDVHFEGGGNVLVQQQSSTLQKTMIFNRCSVRYTAVDGIRLIGNVAMALVDCVVSKAQTDNITYLAYAAVSPAGCLEINVTSRDAGRAGSAANQNSTVHSGGRIVRLNSTYYGAANDQIADVNANTKAWCINCTARDGENAGFSNFRAGNGSGGAEMWLDSCTSSGSTYDLHADTGSTIRTRDFTGDATNTGGGAITTY